MSAIWHGQYSFDNVLGCELLLTGGCEYLGDGDVQTPQAATMP